MLYFAIRRDIDFTRDFDSQLCDLSGIPIELALPHECDDFMRNLGRLPELLKKLKEHDVHVISVHATQNRYRVIRWVDETIAFAEQVRLQCHTMASAYGRNTEKLFHIVFHPEKCGPETKKKKQLEMTEIVFKFKKLYPKIAFCLESFASSARVFTPEDLGELEWQFVLNTSHLAPERCKMVADKYPQHIHSLHLSELKLIDLGDGKHQIVTHHPVRSYGLDVLNILRDNDWSGWVVLEYLPEFYHMMKTDLRGLIELYFLSDSRLELP